MIVAIAKTKTEEALAAQFEATASLLPGSGWVPEARRRAFREFQRSGLPHRRIEAWKYTDLRSAMKAAFEPARCSTRDAGDAALAAILGAELAALPCIRFVLVNGRLVRTAVPAEAGSGVTFHAGSLAAALGQPGYEWVEAAFAASGDGDDPIRALNSAFVTDGLVLRVVAGASLAVPVHIVSIADAASPSALATGNLIKVEANAKATIIESHVEAGSAGAQATVTTLLGVERGGEVAHVKHVAAGAGSMHLGRLDVRIGEAATCRAFQLTLGAGLLRNESCISFTGSDARLDLSGAMLGRGSDHIDTTLVVNHDTPGCESRELFKAVLDDRARAVFQGKVIVQPDAQKTDGKQMAQALMLSPAAEFDSKPELEIYADDVACGHGSTAAEIDPAMLFYLRSRGIPKAEARAMLIESFVGEAIDKITDEALRAALMTLAADWLKGAVRART